MIGPTHDGAGGLDLAAANALLLAPGTGVQGAGAEDVGAAFASCPGRVLPSASRSLLADGPDVARLRDTAAGTAAAMLAALDR